MDPKTGRVLPMVTLSKLQLRTIEEELKAFKKADSLENSFQPEWTCIKEEIDVSDCEDNTFTRLKVDEPVIISSINKSKPSTKTKKRKPLKPTVQIPPYIPVRNPSQSALGPIGEKNWYHHCPGCKITYKSGAGNLCSICSAPMIYQCKKCDKTYKKYLSCYMHIRRTCYPTDFFSCNECSYTTYLKSSLRHHIQIHLDQAKECPRCHKKLKNSFSLRGHLEYCGRKSDLECDYCKIKTLYKKSLKRHIIRHHSDGVKKKPRNQSQRSNCGNGTLELVNGDFDMY